MDSILTIISAALAGVIMTACAAYWGAKNGRGANAQEKHQYYRNAILDKRLSVHQKAFLYSLHLPVAAHNPKRNNELLCIVQEPKDVAAVEKTSRFGGYYYVLLGSISPLDGFGPEDLNIQKLINRLSKGNIKEVVISTNPDNDGELTAQFLIERISRFKLKIYRIGIGIPLGTQIEYIDSATLGKAFLEKKAVS